MIANLIWRMLCLRLKLLPLGVGTIWLGVTIVVIVRVIYPGSRDDAVMLFERASIHDRVMGQTRLWAFGMKMGRDDG